MIGTIIGLLLGAAATSGSLEEGILREMNLARTQPRQYAEYVVQEARNFSGRDLVVGNVRIRTKEGKKAYDEAAAFLRKQKALPPYRHAEPLARAAAELAQYQTTSGTTGHSGANGAGTQQRIEKEGNWSGSIGENVAYGQNDPRKVVIQLIVDDGVQGRGHRKNIFSRDFRLTGTACGPHPSLSTVCVTDFATEVTPRQ